MTSKNELYRLINVYSHNASLLINSSCADPDAKKLIDGVVAETCNLVAALVDELSE